MQNDRINEIFKSRAIRFVKSREESTNEEKVLDKHSSSDFYRSLLDSGSCNKVNDAPEVICSICGVSVLDADSHELSAAHQSSLDQGHKQPVVPLDVNITSSGYRYLEKYGWTRLNRTGLGASGREGSRTPIKVMKKDGRTGIGEHKTPRNPSGTTIGKTLAIKAIDSKSGVISDKKAAQRCYEQEQRRDRQIRNSLK